MRKIEEDNDKKCTSPWFGLFVIVVVCVVLGVAVFLSTGSKTNRRSMNAGNRGQKGGQNVNYILPVAPLVNGVTETEKTLVF